MLVSGMAFPEDVNGLDSYAKLHSVLKGLSHEKHEEYQHYINDKNWRELDIEQINQRLYKENH